MKKLIIEKKKKKKGLFKYLFFLDSADTIIILYCSCFL